MVNKKRILSVLGARPQFIKASMVSRAVLSTGQLEEIIIHTGQHYDAKMSPIFFDEMGVPEPMKNLEVGSASHAQQTAEMMRGLEREIEQYRPDFVLVYGDTNSTLAGSIVASKLCIPIAHVEAGLRSFNRKMPEEINRIVTDHLASLLFCPTKTALENLAKEGIVSGCHDVGDVMIDALYFFRDLAEKSENAFKEKKAFFLLTLHRASNTDDQKTLKGILETLGESPMDIVFPVHPRTKQAIARYSLNVPRNIKMIEPVGYLDVVKLILQSSGVWTDSGGLQKESVVLGKPCFTLRNETEWLETVEEGWNRLVGTDSERIREALASWDAHIPEKPFDTDRFYGDGNASRKISSILEGF